MTDWTDFNPHADDVRAERERSGDGLMVCKRRLRLAAMSTALAFIDERSLDPAVATMLAVLKAIVYEQEEAAG